MVGGKIVLASSPSYCVDVKDHSQEVGALLEISPCIDGDEGQLFTVDWDHKIRQGNRCIGVVEDMALAFSKLELRECGGNQQFVPDVCEHDEHAVPTKRKGSFLVVGDWGWDSLVHGNVPKAACQQEIGMLMTQKMEELGDVKFIINVGQLILSRWFDIQEWSSLGTAMAGQIPRQVEKRSMVFGLWQSWHSSWSRDVWPGSRVTNRWEPSRLLDLLHAQLQLAHWSPGVEPGSRCAWLEQVHGGLE